MNNTELAEIRARLRAAVEPERRREKTSLFGAVAKLFAPAEKPAPARPAPPPPRRAGVPAARASDNAPPVAPIAAASRPAGGRSASGFGRRPEPTPEDPADSFLPLLLLDAHARIEGEPIGSSPVRRLRRVRRIAEAGPTETPYLPEDLADPVELRPAAEAATEPAIRAQPGAAIPERALPERLAQKPAPAQPAPAAPCEPASPERELLSHLMRVLAVEQAALDARRVAA